MTRTRRHEFSKPIRREALRRAEGRCAAVGEVYGLEIGQRCNAPLAYGVEFDHYPIPATDEGSGTLENCVACCKTCHGIKTGKYDIPMQAKGKRVSDKHNGIRSDRRQKIPARPFAKAPPQRRATEPLRKPAAWRGDFVDQ